MSILSTYYVASEKELQTALRGGREKALTHVDGTGFGEKPLDELAKQLGAGNDALEPGGPAVSAEDYAWVAVKLASPMVDALAALPDASLRKTAKALVGTAVDWEPKRVQALLAQLCALARRAKNEKKAMYLWMTT